MAINLRLPEALSAQLRELADRTHRSQTSLIIEAVERLVAEQRVPPTDGRWPAGVLPPGVTPPRVPYYRSSAEVRLPEGVSILDLLDREDRV